MAVADPAALDPQDPTQQQKKATAGAPAIQLPSSMTGSPTNPQPSAGASATPAQAAIGSATAQTSDPLAFAAPQSGTGTSGGNLLPNSTGISLSTGTPMSSTATTSATSTPIAQQGAQAAQDAFTNSSPLSGLTEQQKAQYWAGQGVTGLAQGATPTGTTASGAGQVSTYNPAQVAGNDAALAAAGKNDPAVQGVQAAQAAQLASTNAAQGSANQAQGLQDAQSTLAALKSAGEVDPNNLPAGMSITGPAATQGVGDQALLQQLMNPQSGGPATQGLPTATGSQPNNGAYDAATGTYTLPSSTPQYLGQPSSTQGTPASGGTPSVGTGGGIAGQLASLGAQSATAGPNAGVGLTATDPNNPLTAQTIAPNGSVDRVKNFQDSLNSTIQNVLDPAFAARQKSLNQYNFGAGRGVSGMARTSQGTAASDYGNQIKDLTTQGLTNASNSSIDDMYKDLGIAQQQQQFQAGQEQTGFNQQAELAQLQDQLTNSAFGRAQGQEQAGYANDPSNIGLMLSQIFGNNAAQAGNAAAGAFGNLGKNSQSGGDQNSQILAYLQSLGLGGGSGGGIGNAPDLSGIQGAIGNIGSVV